MRLNLTIAAKLAIAYGLFLLPIAHLGFQMVSDKQTNIAFAQKEILGVHYIADVRDVQDAVVRGDNLSDLIEKIRIDDAVRGADFKTANPTRALIKTLQGPDRLAAARAAADLIGKAADGSGLTLDPDLNSFYTQDALTVKVPNAVAGVASLAATVAATAGHALTVDEQVAFGVQVGVLQATLGGLAADIASAVEGDPDKMVDGAVTASVARVGAIAKTTLSALADHANAGSAGTLVIPLLDAITTAGVADAGVLEHLLNRRSAGFRSAELANGAVAFALFLVAVSYGIIVVQRGTVKPLRTLTRTMRMLAANDVSVVIDSGGRTDEVGDMARAVRVFKENIVESQRLASQRETARATRAVKQDTMERETESFGMSVTGTMAGLLNAADDIRHAAETMHEALAAVRGEGDADVRRRREIIA